MQKGKGYLWLSGAGDLTVVNGNTDGDAAPELAVALADFATLPADYAASDFLL
jgi:hypothetical protein